MDKKQANLCFHHSEKLKSNLFLISGVLDRLTMLKGERLEGGEEVTDGILDTLRNELNMAKRYFVPAEIDPIERELFEVGAKIELQDYARAREHLARSFSYVTTLSDKSIRVLMDEDLI